MVHTCHVCGKSYSSKFNFDYHYAHHFEARPFNCDVSFCKNAYKTKADLRQHQKSHEKTLGMTFVCVECQVLFDSSTKLNVHKREFHSSKKVGSFCHLCNREFTNLRLHQKVVHEKWRPYTCDVDGKTFAKLHGLKRHIEAVHLNLTPFACELCEKKFKEASDLRRHHLSHNKVRKTTTRFRQFQEEIVDWGKDEEIKTIIIRYKCPSCSKLFSSKDFVIKHEQKFHSNASLVCDFCSQRFETRRKILRHIRSLHLTEGNPEYILISSKQFKCGVCFKAISSKKALERHKRVVHERIYDFMCDKCSAEFRDRGALNEHFRKYHGELTDDRTHFNCELCNKNCVSSLKLEKHEAACRLKRQNILNQELDFALQVQEQSVKVEEGIELINIDEIDKGSKEIVKEEIFDSDPFDTETLEESNELPEPVDAEIISKIKVEKLSENLDIDKKPKREILKRKIFKRETSSAQGSKIKIEESDGEPDNIQELELERIFKGETFNVFSRSFECMLCPNDFEKLQDLKLHCVASHRIKKFKCNNCNHSFSERNLFREHFLLKHSGDATNESYFLRNYTIPNENVKCLECNKVLVRKESMKRHMELVHSERQTFFCDKCTDEFKDSRTLKFHIEKHHSDEMQERKIVRRRKTTKALTCEDCGEIVIGRKDLLAHRWLTHLNFKIYDKSRYHCLICKQVLKCRMSAKRHHIQVHQHGKLLVRTCRVCSLSFKLYDDFKAHIEEYHHHENICLICGDRFELFSELFAHEKSHRSVPEDEKKYFCDLCGWRAQQKISIENHMVKQHGGLKKQYQATCEFCGQSFSCYQSFHTHRKNHFREFNKIECSYCDKSYTNLRDLKNHEESHINREDKLFRCEYDGCTRQYNLYRSYRWHVRYTHEQVRNKCRICSVVLSSREKLIAHANEHHPEQRRFRCNRCGKTFTSQSSNIKHMKNCEPTTLS